MGINHSWKKCQNLKERREESLEIEQRVPRKYRPTLCLGRLERKVVCLCLLFCHLWTSPQQLLLKQSQGFLKISDLSPRDWWTLRRTALSLKFHWRVQQQTE